MSAFGLEVSENAVCLFDSGLSKQEALDALIKAVWHTGSVKSEGALRSALYERESIQSTGIGGGVAIPHVRIDAVVRPTLAVGLSQSGIDFDSLDNEPVHVLVLFAMPSGSQRAYLDLLARVMVCIKDPAFRRNLMSCTSAAEAAAFLNRDE